MAKSSFERRLCHSLFCKPYLKHLFSAGNARCLLLLILGSWWYDTGTKQQGVFHCADDGALCAGRFARYVFGSEEGFVLSVLLQQCTMDFGLPDKGQCILCAWALITGCAHCTATPRLTTTQRLSPHHRLCTAAPRLMTTQKRMRLSPKRQKKNITVMPLNKRSRRSISL